MIREFFKPALKCERVGHIPVSQTERGFSYPPEWSYRHVADEVSRTRQVCKRCKSVLSDWAITRECGLSGLTMSSDKWVVLKRDGFVGRG